MPYIGGQQTVSTTVVSTFPTQFAGAFPPHNYALLYAAKGLHHEKGVTESELADPDVIDEEAFRLIMNALLIAKYGTAAFHLKGDIPHEP